MMQKILALESLRGLAALIVVFSHIVAVFYPSMMIGASVATGHSKFEQLFVASPFNLLINGHFAVICFFVLSGFVLSYGFFHRPVDLVAASIKRYFRLVPIVFASVMMSYFLLKFGLYYGTAVAEVSGSGWITQFWTMTDMTLLDALWQATLGTFSMQVPGTKALDPVLWTIYHELVGSLIVYAFLALMGKDRRRWIMYVILTLVLISTPYVGFILGMILCDVFSHKPQLFNKISRLKKGYKIILLTGGITIAAYPSYLASPEDLGVVHSAFTLFSDHKDITKTILHALSSIIFIVLILTSHRIKTILEMRPFVSLGSMSYSMYATHLLVLGSAGCFIFLAFNRIMPYNYAVLATIPLFLAISLGVAYLFRKYVDEPSILISKHVIKIFNLGPPKRQVEDTTENLL